MSKKHKIIFVFLCFFLFVGASIMVISSISSTINAFKYEKLKDYAIKVNAVVTKQDWKYDDSDDSGDDKDYFSYITYSLDGNTYENIKYEKKEQRKRFNPNRNKGYIDCKS